MPTKKKRVGFIPRDDVLNIINILSIENNLSNSKIISILVEEALSTRGIFNNKNCKDSQSYLILKQDSESLSEESINFKDNEEFTIDTRLVKKKISGEKPLLKQSNQEKFDLQTYKKFLSFLKFQEMINEYDA